MTAPSATATRRALRTLGLVSLPNSREVLRARLQQQRGKASDWDVNRRAAFYQLWHRLPSEYELIDHFEDAA
jgi:ribose 1,5-bisphosphokinase PhnN